MDLGQLLYTIKKIEIQVFYFCPLLNRTAVKRYRKSTDVPYIAHLMEVMQILIENNCEKDVIIAGILHDTLEDTKTTQEEIRSSFGERILSIVQSETEDKKKPGRKENKTQLTIFPTHLLRLNWYVVQTNFQICEAFMRIKKPLEKKSGSVLMQIKKVCNGIMKVSWLRFPMFQIAIFIVIFQNFLKMSFIWSGIVTMLNE